ncbi:hypothetical protein CC2G_003625 [Coprinopsis cinerea AmutBmut pab1-1]|nr:hypothetical protein CC2G_003625 [Coprinopsis cinerea AmutBmut pab1-1]
MIEDTSKRWLASCGASLRPSDVGSNGLQCTTIIRILELFHTFCVSAEVYRTTIVHYGNPASLINLPWMAIAIFASATVTFLTHTFFASRVWIVLPHPWRFIGPVCMFLTFVAYILSLVSAVAGVIEANLIVYEEKWGWTVYIVLISGVVLDIVLSSSMVFYLWLQRGRVLDRSMRLIDRVVQYTICTGVLTSVTALGFVISFGVENGSFIWVAFFTCHAKLYSNSILATLNSRMSFRAPGTSVSSRQQSSSHAAHRMGAIESYRGSERRPVKVNVEMTSSVHREEDVKPVSVP